MRRRLRSFAALSALFLMAACATSSAGGTDPSASTAQRTAAATATASSRPTAPTSASQHAVSTSAARRPSSVQPPSTGVRRPETPAEKIAQAEADAKTAGKRVLLDFGADWCPDCHALDGLFKTATVAPILSRSYVLVHIDVGQFDKNMKLSARYGHAADVGIPALVVLDGSGTMVEATSDGSFADARAMTAAQVAAFLRRWSPVKR
jgi:thiol:disulfide interchange protein